MDCFIVEQIGIKTEESDQYLANFPSTLVYTFANLANFTVKNLLLTNRKYSLVNRQLINPLSMKKDQSLGKGGDSPQMQEEKETSELPAVKESISYDEIRKKVIFTYICNLQLKYLPYESQGIKDRVFGLDSKISSSQRNLHSTFTPKLLPF